MALQPLICKSCGGILNIDSDNPRDYYCPYCGTKHTWDRIIVEIAGIATETSLIERAEILLSDGSLAAAKNCFDKALEINPRSTAAYMGLVKCANKAKTLEELEQDRMLDFSGDSNYRRALEYSVGNDHVNFARVNSPDHLYKVGVYKLGADFTRDKAAMETKHGELLASLKNRVSSLESSLAYDRNRVQTDRLNLSRKKGRYTGAVLKSLIFPFFLLALIIVLAVFGLPTAARAFGTYGFLGAALLLIILIIWMFVRFIKAFTRNKRLYPGNEKNYLRNSEQEMARRQTELAQTRQTLAQCEISMKNEMQQFLNDSEAAKAKFRKEFAAAHQGYKLPD